MELVRLNVGIAALCETRLSEGKLEETGYGYTLLWKGKNEGESLIQRSGFALKTCIIRDHHLTPSAINE